MGPTGADDFPKRAVVSDCEPLKLKGRLKEGATAQTQLREGQQGRGTLR